VATELQEDWMVAAVRTMGGPFCAVENQVLALRNPLECFERELLEVQAD